MRARRAIRRFSHSRAGTGRRRARPSMRADFDDIGAPCRARAPYQNTASLVSYCAGDWPLRRSPSLSSTDYDVRHTAVDASPCLLTSLLLLFEQELAAAHIRGFDGALSFHIRLPAADMPSAGFSRCRRRDAGRGVKTSYRAANIHAAPYWPAAQAAA